MSREGREDARHANREKAVLEIARLRIVYRTILVGGSAYWDSYFELLLE